MEREEKQQLDESRRAARLDQERVEGMRGKEKGGKGGGACTVIQVVLWSVDVNESLQTPELPTQFQA